MATKTAELTVEDRIERLVIWSGVEGRPEVASLGTDSGEVDDDKQKAFEREQQAFAALFAAAPDLLEALKGLMRLDIGCSCRLATNANPRRCAKCVATAAIAKAEAR